MTEATTGKDEALGSHQQVQISTGKTFLSFDNFVIWASNK